ncbi:2-succinyl-5-enolpyruvyl-6-hydroxy-3-cyclohexene-1-carboxylic-acid synthase [Aquibacillus salsiterrae]|uniref:2-succinyl-5-enolpyruvyl-6-hydroxy-3-cyclohexene-1-carboxylate synthase n=1 Tax=Aquibacillus salsiterrae TaxID=2950439 RepID=A0A9X4AG40_9BACI|nr:2-succinyl-5-enolpyruvyl-6-hydroxy-3-cyclohexene-1-carboxylic-acid synthase [Aquibacillus salsiterrae]MDC3418284.1 2-succinyl-5-enolpyruvyl-6-hydroxy-3-cyclohexene-1-carboxylic-acid synthase [Aquibacillus salsiterrae]
MTHTEVLTRYVANFIDELYQSGLTDVVISPGSRSTPLAMTFAEHPNIHHWINLDERSAAFFALGMAKQLRKPVAIVCTSGTAAANYFPAIVEAYYARVPLVVLTADRPHELRDVGAPQAIDQINLYGKHVKWFQEMALPDSTLFSYVRGMASRAVFLANAGNAGPVHLNFPFREPLVPDFTIENLWGEKGSVKFHEFFDGSKAVTHHDALKLTNVLQQHKRGLLVCGPQEDDELAREVARLAEVYNIPLLADPLSGIRAGTHPKINVIESYDTILKSKEVRDYLKPDYIIRFGAMPVSKSYMLLLKENPLIDHFVIEEHAGFREPVGMGSHFIYSNPIAFCAALEGLNLLTSDKEWLHKWNQMNAICTHHLMTEDDPNQLTEGHVVKYLQEYTPNRSTLYVGNSMPIRDMDTFFLRTNKEIKVLGNRGVNGIDGLTSSGLGAAAHGEVVTLLVGDLTFFHDMNGLLLAKQYGLRLTIVLINNNGGGIFSFLPQAKEKSKHYEVLFGTPLDIDFFYTAELYGASYTKVTSWEEFKVGLANAYIKEGISIIEVQTNRDENVKWHQQKWKLIQNKLLKELRGE